MKKTVLYGLGIALATSSIMATPTFAASTPTQSWDPTLTQAKSCAEVESVFKEYFTTNRYGGYFGPMREGAVTNDSSVAQGAMPPEAKGGAGGGSSFSETNNQKAGVEEPDIIKNDGTYIYYADMQQNRQIHIVSAANGKQVATIKLPSDFRGAQLFVTKGKLIAIGPKTAPYISYRSSMIAQDQKVLVLVYDTTNISAPKLQNAYEYDGYMQEARMIDGKLVMVTSQPFTWGPIYFAQEKAVSASAANAPKPEDFSFVAKDILPKRTSMRHTTIKYKNGTTRASTVKNTTQVDCTNVFYKKPDKEAKNGSMWGQSLTSIITFPLTATNGSPTIKTILGNTSQVHVTTDTVYVTAPSYVYTPMSCPINARCLMPIRSQGNYTTIHKFSLPALTYNYSTAVKGTTYNQYSMDDTNGTFRIVTSDRSTNRNVTNVYTVNDKGTIAGKLENIAPGEQFHGVRFLNDYLYLVTYRQIDPLFVIDLSNAAKPAIIGELKMPGYSTYLHPYGARQGSIQYLIGIGYNTSVDANGNERQGGVKIDLYKADFAQKDSKGNIGVSQVWTKTFGEQGSQTEALHNPRMFVFNNTTKELLLPLVTTRIEKTEQCNIVYGSNGKEIRKDCYPQETPITTFAGVKGWKVGVDALTETVSLDYKEILKNPYAYAYTTSSGTVDPWIFGSTMARVGYVRDKYFFVNSQFAHFFQKNNLQGTRVDFPYTAPKMEDGVTPLKGQG